MKINGFTLFELLITMALLATLSVIATSSYSYFLRKNERQIILDGLRSSVHYAKIQALTLDTTVFLTPLDDSLTWTNGIMVSTKNKKTHNMKKLYQWQWHHLQWELNWVGARAGNRITFSNDPAKAISNGHFILKNTNTGEETIIVLNRLGRVRETNNLSLIH